MSDTDYRASTETYKKRVSPNKPSMFDDIATDEKVERKFDAYDQRQEFSSAKRSPASKKRASPKRVSPNRRY